MEILKKDIDVLANYRIIAMNKIIYPTCQLKGIIYIIVDKLPILTWMPLGRSGCVLELE